jgi:hypothetical protein
MVINLAIMALSYFKRQEEAAFLFPPKSGFIEIIFCTLITFGHGFTLALVPGIPTYVMSAFASYSLFSGRCPESAVYRDNDQEFTLGSNHYQRAISNIMTAVIMYQLDLDQTWLFIVVYVMHVLGIIAHPLVTVFWALEQISIHLLGTSPRASDSRILAGLLLNVGFVAICFYVKSFGAVPF